MAVAPSLLKSRKVLRPSILSLVRMAITFISRKEMGLGITMRNYRSTKWVATVWKMGKYIPLPHAMGRPLPLAFRPTANTWYTAAALKIKPV